MDQTILSIKNIVAVFKNNNITREQIESSAMTVDSYLFRYSERIREVSEDAENLFELMSAHLPLTNSPVLCCSVANLFSSIIQSDKTSLIASEATATALAICLCTFPGNTTVTSACSSALRELMTYRPDLKPDVLLELRRQSGNGALDMCTQLLLECSAHISSFYNLISMLELALQGVGSDMKLFTSPTHKTGFMRALTRPCVECTNGMRQGLLKRMTSIMATIAGSCTDDPCGSCESMFVFACKHKNVPGMRAVIRILALSPSRSLPLTINIVHPPNQNQSKVFLEDTKGNTTVQEVINRSCNNSEKANLIHAGVRLDPDVKIGTLAPMHGDHPGLWLVVDTKEANKVSEYNSVNLCCARAPLVCKPPISVLPPRVDQHEKVSDLLKSARQKIDLATRSMEQSEQRHQATVDGLRERIKELELELNRAKADANTLRKSIVDLLNNS